MKGKIPISGTGFLIGSDIVLTAAHNVVSLQGVKYTNINFYPGTSGPLDEKKRYEVIDMRFETEYIGGANGVTHDYALLKIDRPVKVQGAKYIEIGLGYISQK